MEFTVHEPPPQLADSVKAIWCARGTRQEFDAPEPIVPDGCVEVIFNLGERFINADAGDLQPRDLLAGQMTRPVIALPTGDVDLIGVRFKTGRAGAALRVPMAELQDRLIAASDVVSGLDRIAGDLRGVAQDDRLNHLARSLGERLAPIDADSLSAVDHALAIIGAMRGNVAIERVAQRVGITRRHLERHFREHVGLGAKHLARITPRAFGVGVAAAAAVDERRRDRGRMRLQRSSAPDPRMPAAYGPDATAPQDDGAIAGGLDARSRRTRSARSGLMNAVKTALVVEGGGLRGAFPAGVLQVLLARFGPDAFDGIFTVSSGVFASTFFIAGQGAEMEAIWRDRVCGHQLVDHRNWFTGKPVLRLDYLIDLFKGPARLDLGRVMNSRPYLEYVLTDYGTHQPVHVDAKSR